MNLEPLNFNKPLGAVTVADAMEEDACAPSLLGKGSQPDWQTIQGMQLVYSVGQQPSGPTASDWLPEQLVRWITASVGSANPAEFITNLAQNELSSHGIKIEKFKIVVSGDMVAPSPMPTATEIEPGSPLVNAVVKAADSSKASWFKCLVKQGALFYYFSIIQ
eukprot:TRINITY_DN67251_c13_g1_i1.p2 TRINITY_DN67251_c13_g1~~TRINITY_DN67251_c13_g1_i1.p2  ORF type:complete len:175 (-),score=15.91 TRINITY_DN67251_c13_g1_i1:1842-2330(-)